ncbi:MFS general substrate transporter [Armillaria mellea]|nr:MFS general substrate transporter [Armillaria mellea]
MSTIAASVNQAGQDTIELEDIRPTPSTSQSIIVQNNGEDSDEAPLNATSLPPMDHGFDAWAYMISAWLIELLVWSYPFSYGVFLNYYSSHEFKDSSSTLLALVGSLSTGLIYLSSIVILPIITRYPARKKQMMYVGLGLSVAGLIGAAFSNTPEMLVLTQGVMYSIGGSFLYFPVMTYLFEWFSDKKGLANGLIFSGTGVGGVVMPIITEALLNKYGRKVTMLALATSFALLVIPAFPYIKPRFLKYHPFWVLSIANLVQGLGIFLPTLYLPTFATDLGLNNATSVGTWSLSLMNGASAPGLIFLGYLSDRFDLRISIFISALGSSLAVLFIWGFTTHIAPLLVFACVYGFLAPSWSAMWPRFISTVAGDDPHQASIMMGIFMAGRGVGNALSTPISSGLLRPWAFTGKSIFPYSLEGYGPLILFTGITLLVSTLGISYRKPDRTTTNIAERIPRRFRRASISPP